MTLSRKEISRKGFTLVELLTVIAIIGILAAILIPAVGSVRTKADQAKSSSNMRQIGLGYNNYSSSGGRTKIIGQGSFDAENNKSQASNPAEWAQVLAVGADLTDSSLYFIDSDDEASQAYAEGSIPLVVGVKGDSGWTFNGWSDSLPISYAMVVSMSANSPQSTTPLVWTRGLDSAGEWSDVSPWAGDGGHIAFMDGHVTFYKEIDDQLVSYTGEATSNIEDAIKTSSGSSAAKVEIEPSSN